MIDIGAGTIDICGMKGMVPTPDDQATIKKAGDHIDEELASAIALKYPGVQITKSVARGIKEKHSFVGEINKPVMATLRMQGKPVEYNVSEEIKNVCENIVPDIMERLDTLIMKFDPEDQEETLKNIFLAGGGSNILGLDRMIADQLKDFGDVVVTRVNDPEFIGCAGALKLAGDIPSDQWKQIGTMFGNS
ncbi:MAG: rod shape-determining protein [Thermodesulfobacteriota bacterium]|nr:rod shape-determining protein [Thermodesulfobacteriota bacterium]